ncbi:non-ribosomal peptide synthetase [Massilia scottii]|uniref:non-ribosomal peptide synthetase n=1 Tax=Massilia scottii TaxID=3057166 RepID=UPI002796ABB6|nr:non-ribosomal peptide synthetase [Massilia sp. CCM 9029]MDQ1835371.1 amino acid adenylation domain-containing protein [Massilia sp. CCM 9029]
MNSTPIAPGAGSAFESIVDLVIQRAREDAEKRILVFLDDGVTEAGTLTYARLHRDARALAATLQQTYPRGSRALLLYPPGLDFVVAFFGCLYAGLIAVPAYPPKRNQKAARLLSIFNDAAPSVILASSAIVERMAGSEEAHDPFSSTATVATDTIDASMSECWVRHDVHAGDMAFLQYTSGSTSAPKGVMVTHANLIANSAYIQQAFRLSSRETISVSWLPSYHDMGLIDGILQPIHTGFTGYLMPPPVFFQQPFLWLQAISKYRATHSGGPDFAYSLCARAITPEQRQELDLGCWTSAYNGAEPVRASTLDLFAATFQECGFEPRFYFPCYGMAETTLMVTGVAFDEAPPMCTLDAQSLEHGMAIDAHGDDTPTVRLVSSGHVFADTEVVIADAASCARRPDNEVGEIWVCGPSVAAGYWGKDAQSAATFAARLHGSPDRPYLRTGDLGFLRRGELFVTGRLKDLIIVRGRNHYPHDIELAAERSHAGLRPSCNAAFTIENDGEEQLIIVQEVERTQVRRLDGADMAARIRHAVMLEHGISPHVIAFLAPGKIFKTSSGKIQRQACREAYLDGTLEMLELNLENHADPADSATLRGELRALPVANRQRRLAAYFQEVLGRLLDVQPLQVDLDATFSDLGLDSIGVAQFRQRLQASLGSALAASDMFRGATMRALVIAAAAGLSNEAEDTASCVVAGPDRQDGPLSRGQQAIWFLHQMQPEGSAYNLALAVDITSQLNPACLHAALDAVAERHDCLRAHIVVVDGQPRQRVRPAARADVTLLDASSWSDAMLEQAIDEATHTPFDLGNDSLFRVRLYSRSPDQHSLLIVAHHIIMDFRSIEIIVEELTATYAALRANRAPGWRRLHRQAIDFAIWQQQMLDSDAARQHAAYWTGQLAGMHPALALPFDRQKRADTPPDGHVLRFPFGASLSGAVRNFAKQHGVTAYTLLLALFKVQLHRYTGQSDIAVGSSVDARPSAQFANTVGYLVNQVVIRSAIGGDAAFCDILARVSETCQDAWNHQDLPFSTLVEQISPERSNSKSPLFDVMFGFLRPPKLQGLGGLAAQCEGTTVRLGGLSLSSRRLERRAAQFDLMLTIIDTGESLTGCWEYDRQLFDTSTVERMNGHFLTLLQAVMREPTCPVSRLELLTPCERAQLLEQFQPAPTPYPHEQVATAFFEHHAARSPSALAVQAQDSTMTYQELNERANMLAHFLRSAGAGPDSLVGICFRRTPAMVVAMLAVLKSGAAYVPLDPAQPQERLDYMVNDADLPILLTEASLSERFRDGSRKVVQIDADWENIASCAIDHSVALAIPAPSPHSLAYVMYTSGSTGQPKGVMVTHAGLMNYLSWATQAYALERGCGAPVNSSFSFDATVTSLLAPLLTGAKVVLIAEDDEIAALAEALRGAERYSLVKITPAHLEILKSYFPPGSASVSTNAFVVGGEALALSTVSYWREHSPDTRVVNEYGPTETVVGCCVYDVINPRALSGNVPIGRPIANTQMHILDPHLQLVPMGMVGEIYIGGAGVARGYLQRPELTAERFIDDPFSAAPDARMYRTGDLARWMPDGNMDYVGRNDSQVKIRGFRIELGEIESTILDHPAVHEAAVTLHVGANGNKHLVAHLVCPEMPLIDRQERLQAHVAGKLPKYMLPSHWVFMEHLPLTPNGKIDRQRLSLPVSQVLGNTANGRVVPTTQLQQKIAQVWEALLDISGVGVNDNFFDVGGHSLLAAQVHQRLCAMFGEGLTIVDMYRYPTINGLAQHISQHAADTPVSTGSQLRGQQRREQVNTRRMKMGARAERSNE